MAVAVVMAVPIGAGEGKRWLHVKVDESKGSGERVRVNLPLAMLEKVAGAIDLETLEGGRYRGGRLRIDADRTEGVDIRALWQAVRSAGNMEFVTVESEDETVRVARDDRHLIARVNGRGREKGKGEKVEVRIPLVVVDALFSAGEKELNLVGALQALAEHGVGDLVTVDDDETSVRIWIDGRSSAD